MPERKFSSVINTSLAVIVFGFFFLRFLVCLGEGSRLTSMVWLGKYLVSCSGDCLNEEWFRSGFYRFLEFLDEGILTGSSIFTIFSSILSVTSYSKVSTFYSWKRPGILNNRARPLVWKVTPSVVLAFVFSKMCFGSSPLTALVSRALILM